MSKILFVGENRSADVVKEALSTGAVGYVLKSDAARDLLPAIEAVLEGKRILRTSVGGHDLVTSQIIEDKPYLRFAGSAPISQFLTDVIKATDADFGTVQLFDSTNHTLRIVAQHGFANDFLNSADNLSHEDHSACTAALNERSRIVVREVATETLLSSDVRRLLLRQRCGPTGDSIDRLVPQTCWRGVHLLHQSRRIHPAHVETGR